jgi:hypothetical protein
MNQFMAFVSAFRFAALACFIVAVATSVSADEILYEHPFPNTPTGGWCSSCQGSYRVWDQFDLTSNSTITEIQARLHFVSLNNSIEYSIWDPTRTTQYFAQSIAPGDLSISGTPVHSEFYEVAAEITGLVLPLGTYALSIYYVHPTTFLGWVETETVVHGRSFQSDGGFGSNKDMVFRIIGTAVPEPSGIAPFAIGLAATMLRRRRN